MRTQTRVPVQQVVEGEVIQLAAERKHLTDLLKMIAYQAEGDLLHILTSHYRRSENEGRTLIQNALASPGDIAVTETELRVSLKPLSSPHRTHALAALCEQLNKTKTRFPGSRLCLHLTVQKEPSPSMATVLRLTPASRGRALRSTLLGRKRPAGIPLRSLTRHERATGSEDVASGWSGEGSIGAVFVVYSGIGTLPFPARSFAREPPTRGRHTRKPWRLITLPGPSPRRQADRASKASSQ